MKLLLLMLVTSLPVIADNEYSPREVQIGKFDEFSTTFPLDVTKEECSEYFFYSGLASQLIGSTLLTKIEFKGYNPGKEIQRHLKLWFNDKPGDLSRKTLLFDGDYVIPSGGSESERIALLSFDVNMPVSFPTYGFEIDIECTGAPADEPVYFEFDRNSMYRPVITFILPTKVENLSGNVMDQKGNPVSGAEVLVYRKDNPGYKALTNAQGRYNVRIENSNVGYIMQVSAPGYANYNITSGITASGYYCLSNEPVEDVVLCDHLDYSAGKMATIVLPKDPDASLGRYYRFDCLADRTVYFEREEHPKANVPYVIFPAEDFVINLSDFDLTSLPQPEFVPAFPDDDNMPYGFYGTYNSTDIDYMATILDDTPDCVADVTKIRRAGAFRCYFYGVSNLGYNFKKENFVFVGEQTGISDVEQASQQAGTCFDLQGRRLNGVPQRGMYIRDGRKYVVK